MEDNERGQEVEQADDMYYWCACVAGKPLPLLFSSLLSYPSLPLCSSEYLHLPSRSPPQTFPILSSVPLSSLENTHTSLPVSDTFRQESQPSSPSLDISREHAHACTLSTKSFPLSARRMGTQSHSLIAQLSLSAFYPYEESAHQSIAFFCISSFF